MNLQQTRPAQCVQIQHPYKRRIFMLSGKEIIGERQLSVFQQERQFHVNLTESAPYCVNFAKTYKY